MPTPLEIGNAVVAPPAAKPPRCLPSGLPLLGFHTMVAPINKNEQTQGSLRPDCSLPGIISKLFRGKNASPPVAPSLHNCLRTVLEQQKMSPEDVGNFLQKCPGLQRYNSAFQKLWVILRSRGVEPVSATVQEVAVGLMSLHSFSKNDSRNAYSAMLLFPGFQALRFHSMITVLKKEWTGGAPKYGAFWSAEPLLQQLLHATPTSSINLMPLCELRLQLILVCRLLMLHRGIDLSRVLRTVSVLGGRPFMKIQRKGWKAHQWEEILSIPETKIISPWHLVQEYVARTSGKVPPGGPF